MNKPDSTWTGKKFNNRLKLCVYAWVRGKRWLYVGSSSNVLFRITDHPVINFIEPVLNSDRILFWRFDNKLEASKHELRLIKKRNPKYNIKGNEGRGISVYLIKT